VRGASPSSPESDRPNPVGAGLRRLSRGLQRLKRRLTPVEPLARPRRLGIPRGFYFYEYPRLFETFFSALGIEVVVSDRTSRKTIECGSRLSEAEHCLPNKLFDAHVTELVDKVDMLFVPRVLSMMPGHNECPKLGALPEAVAAEMSQGLPVLSVDVNEDEEPLRDTLARLGRTLGFERSRALGAADRALAELAAARARRARPRRRRDTNMLVIGHPYTLHDPFISGPVLRKLDALEVGIELLVDDGQPVPTDFVRWGSSNRTLQRLRALQRDSCAGVIHLSCFNCGCDAMMIEFFRAELRERRIAYLPLVIDEHSGSAGVDTRLEAFVDSLAWNT
jgi:predicted nucleotide-binding protein (sugar kinase/HSP70/actin superfamily)